MSQARDVISVFAPVSVSSSFASGKSAIDQRCASAALLKFDQLNERGRIALGNLLHGLRECTLRLKLNCTSSCPPAMRAALQSGVSGYF